MRSPSRVVVIDGAPSQPSLFRDTARYWYVVAAKCGAATFQLDYHMEFRNLGGPMNDQFSWDEQGLYAMYLALFVIWSAVIVVHWYGNWQLRRAGELNLVSEWRWLMVCPSPGSPFWRCFRVRCGPGPRLATAQPPLHTNLMFQPVLPLLMLRLWARLPAAVSHGDGQHEHAMGDISAVFDPLCHVRRRWHRRTVGTNVGRA